MARTKVTTDVLADDAVTTAKIADNAITSAKIGVDVIVAEDLAANSITVSEITDDAVTTAKIADDAITSALIADDAVVAAAIADDAVVQAAIADEAVDEARLQISNAGSNGQFLSKQSGNTGGLTWADAGGGWTDCTEGLVTSTAGQNNIDFSIPAGGVNQIRFMEWNTSQEANGERWVQLGDGSSIKTSGYLTTSTYAWTGGNMSLAETTNAIRHDGWSSVANIWFSVGNLFSIDNGRRWWYEWEAYSDPYGEYVVTTRGHVDMGSGNVARTLRFATQAADGYDADGLFRVYYATMG
tara:strand:- start:223 stop:1116 length:894 start_codon:yes stop_codon:yes gene_type:complete